MAVTHFGVRRRGIIDADAGSLLNAVLREIIASVIDVAEYSLEDCQCLQKVLVFIQDQVTANDKDASLFPHRPQSSEDDSESLGFLPKLESPKLQRKNVAVDGILLQQPVDELCPVKVVLERCVSAWPKYVELVGFFDLRLADVAQRWADGNGPLAMHMTGLEVARLVEAVFERTGRRDDFVHQLRRNPSVHVTAV